MRDEAHAQAFTVAKAARLDILQDIRGGLLDAMEQGQTLATFEKNLKPLLQAKGWWGQDVVIDPDTLDAQLVQLGSSRRLKTIYQTNLQSAYMAGRHKRQMQSGAFRYLMYVAVMDGRTRPSHAALNGKVFAKDDPVWDSHYPPNGFNCRCRTRALTAGQVKREGRKVDSSDGRMLTREVNAGVDKVTGEVTKTRQSGIRVKDPITGRDTVMWTDAGFNASPAAGHLMDQMLYDRAVKALPEEAAYEKVAAALASEIRRKAWRAFVDNTLSWGMPQRQTMTLGLLPRALAVSGERQPVLYLPDQLLVGPKARRHADRGEMPDQVTLQGLPDMLDAATWYLDTQTGNLVALRDRLAITFDASGKADSVYLDKLAREKIDTKRWVPAK
jgi:SPP1 gp7 family putative phage head morphogenesis protein